MWFQGEVDPKWNLTPGKLKSQWFLLPFTFILSNQANLGSFLDVRESFCFSIPVHILTIPFLLSLPSEENRIGTPTLRRSLKTGVNV